MSTQHRSITPLLCLLFLFASLTSSAQTKVIKGQILDAQNQKPIGSVRIQHFEDVAYTARDGRFYMQTPYYTKDWVLTIIKDGYRTKDVNVPIIDDPEVDLGQVFLEPEENIDQFGGEDFIPTISIETEADNVVGTQNVSGLLTASRDVFISAAAFGFGAARFRLRGYQGNNTTVMLNGTPINDLESGFTRWSLWGGLNDVMRNRTNTVGLGINTSVFGGISGSATLDTRASLMRKQIRVSYAVSNRSYRNRIMGTYSSGVTPKGWAVTVSGSRRWAEEGFIPGTFYDAYSYFLSIDKQISKKHSINFTGFGAPVRQGRGSAATMEMYDLAGTNYYNPNWGLQSGEKRNARVSERHQPHLSMRYDFKMSDKTSLMGSVTYQFGRSGITGLDWYDARDPRPNYYRRLPSFTDNSQQTAVEEALRNDESLRQIDWAYMYNVNRNNFATIENANGVPGDIVNGNRSQYILEERRFDTERLSVGGTLESTLADNITLSLGAFYQTQDVDNYKVVDDLLGGDFYVDINKFAEFEQPNDEDFIQNNLDRPNGIAREGDRFGYDYTTHARKLLSWIQAEITTPKVDFHVGVQSANTSFWRTGNIRNGQFPNSSLGESSKNYNFDLRAKVGSTVKLNGRNYLVANAMFISQAPFLQDAYVSPRTRDQLVPNLRNERIYGGEVGYFIRAPRVKMRLLGYYTIFENQLFNRSFYLDNAIRTEDGTRGGFVNYIMNGIKQEHVGLEFGGELNLARGFTFSAAAAVGQYRYANRPQVATYLDIDADQLESQQVYIKNFYIPNTPQKAYNVALRYNSPKYWFASLSANFFDDIWLDFNPSRRTVEAVSYVENPQYDADVVTPDSDLWNSILDQEKAPFNYTLDFFGGKSWKFGNVFIYLNVGVNNILDTRDFITGGYEQFRFDFEGKDVNRFPNRYFYGLGRNYFVSLTFRM